MATIPPKTPEKGHHSASPAGNESAVLPAESNGSPATQERQEAHIASRPAVIAKPPGPPPLVAAAVPNPAPSAPNSSATPSLTSARAKAPAAGGPFSFNEAEDYHSGRWLRAIPSWLASMIFHTIVLLVMAVWINPIREDKRVELTALTTEPTELQELTADEIQPLDVTALDTSEMDAPSEDITIGPGESIAETFNDQLAATTTIELGVDGSFVESSVLAQTISQGMGESLAGVRAGANREAAIRKGGGNADSEAAVAAALKWLTTQQLSDGGWTFDLRKTPNPNPDPGTAERARNAATGLALLPFLGAGHTPKEGRYASVVRRGFHFLSESGRAHNLLRYGPGISWVEPDRGDMYAHGIASIAFCEAYAMTNDKVMLPYAQASVNFIAAAQCGDGGWRYQPNDPTGGDTSVVGWQLMALKSASMGYQLSVPQHTLVRAYRFLDSVQLSEGAAYRYMVRRPQISPATTAIGLLSRMYFGWKKDNPALQKGVEYLANRGPSTGKQSDMYYNYYATQVMKHWEGEEWEQWNKVMRDFLIQTQAKKGAATGSWHFDENHANYGGRLYTTSLATMTLEVYYRHLPLYQKNTTEAEFKP
jgi:hypothetical protein